MPTDVSNSVGTARQFTPKPDRTYQGNYLGVSPSQSSVGAGVASLTQLAQNMMQLNSALQGYAVSHEKYLDSVGLIDAQNMIDGMSAKDIQRLNTIDAAQQEGFADATANPYFKAYAEKLRGRFMATQMKREYDETYSMNPAKSMEEEQHRYARFSQQWKTSHTQDNSAPTNVFAFDTGYGESNVINLNNLGNDWIKTKHQEDITNTMYAIQSELSEIVRTSSSLLETPNAMSQKLQSVLNEARMMGLPADKRNSLLYNFGMQLTKTGHLDGLRFYQMAHNVTVQTSIDGTTTTLADILPMEDMQYAASQYQNARYTQERQDTVQSFIDNKDLKGANEYYETMEANDPDGTAQYEADRQRVIAGIQQKKTQEAAAVKAQLAADKKNMTLQTEHNTVDGSLKTWVEGGEVYNGQAIATMSFTDKEYLTQHMIESLQYAMTQGTMSDKTRVAYLASIMSFPPARQIVSGIQKQYEGYIDAISPDGNGGNTASQTAYTLLRFYQSNTTGFQGAFGESLANKMGVITRLTNMYNGDVTQGLNAYAKYNATDTQVINAYKSDIQNWLGKYENHYTVELPTIGANGVWGSASVWQDASWQQKFGELGAVFMVTTGGKDMLGAINNVGALLQDGYRYYHGAMLPKQLWGNLGLGDANEDYMAKALDFLVYKTAGSYYAPNADQFDCAYDTENRILYITNPYTSESVPYDADALRKLAIDIYKDDAAKWTTASSSATTSGDSTLTAQEVRQRRVEESTKIHNDRWANRLQ